MQIGDRFIGRDREVAQLELAIGPGDDGLRIAMLVGPSGLGKTTLSRVVVERAADRGFDIAISNGRAGTMSTPFLPWLEALPSLKPAIERYSSGSASDMDQLGIELVRLLTEACVERPLLLVIDDAQALDESSLALLPYAMGVSDRLNLSVLLIEQSDAVGVPDSYRAFVDGLVARRVVQHIALGPMSDESISELVRCVLELDGSAPVPTEVVLRAQGNPWFAQELALAYGRGEQEIPVSIAAAATARLHALGETAQDLVSAIALCPDGAYIGWLEALAGERPRQFARTMESISLSGLVREDGEVVSIAHPLMQQALLDELSAAMRRALHQELAEAVLGTQMGEVARSRALGYHISQVGRPDEAVAHFLSAAEANEVHGQLHEAVADYVRALDAEPRIEQRVDLLKRCAFACMQVGNERAVEYWAELGRIAAARDDDATYAYALFQQYWTSSDGIAIDRLERAAALGPEVHGWSARAAACLCTLAGDYDGAITHDMVALEKARAVDDHDLEALALEKLSLSFAYVGRLDESIDVARQAVQKCIARRLHGWAYTSWNALSEALAENLETERSQVEALANLKYVDDLDLVRYRPSALATVARAQLRLGRLEQAAESIDRAMQLEMRAPAASEYRTFVLWTRAVVAVETGNVTLAQGAVADAIASAEEMGFASWIFEARFEQARYLVLRGDIAGALEIVRSLQISEPVAMASLSLWLSRSAMMFDNAEARELAASLRSGIEARFPLDELMLLEIDAHAGSGSDDGIEALRHVARSWEEAGRGLDAARTLLCVGALLARAGKGSEAVAVLTDVRARFASFGATFDADFSSQLLRSLGTRSRARSRSTTVGNLTRRELEIARLVASGLRNAEVAGQLFLAEKTVAAHLSNIYGKLEIRSRVQLASWLQENDSESAVAS